MIRHNKIVILMGALMILASLAWMLEPYYTWAQDQNGHPCRIELDPEAPLFDLENMNPGDSEESSVTVTKVGSAPAELFFAWEWVDGDPEKGEEGSLYEQIEMVIESEGEVVFEGRMSEWDYDSEDPSKDDAINLTEKLGIDVIEQDDEITLDFWIYLPGPETGNEYQGSNLTTRLVFFTTCTGDDEPPPSTPPPPPPPPENGNDEPDDADPEDPDEPDTPDEVELDPDDPEVSPEPAPEEEVEEEEEEATVIVEPEAPQVEPPLPRTDGVSIGLFIFGIFLVMAGISLRRSIREEG